MHQKAFYSKLNEFCMKWAAPVSGSVTTYGGPLRTEAPGFQTQFRVHQEAIFEQLLLFDSIDINIGGPNVIAPLLYNHIGAKSFEKLLDQNAITFVVWQPVPLISHKDGKVAATFAGRFGDGTDSELDIEKIVDLGLAIQPNNMSPSHKRELKRKLIVRHSLLNQNLSADAWVIADKALKEGALKHRGLSSELEIIGASLKEGEELLNAAESILKYRYVLSKGMTSLDDQGVYDLFDVGTDRFSKASSLFEKFAAIAEYEKFPNLRSLYGELEDPFRRAAGFRDTYNARKFREWLSAVGSESDVQVIREYVDECGNRKGLFESGRAKFLKLVTMIAVGHFASSLSLGADVAVSAILTSIPTPIIDNILATGSELSLGVIDSFLLENLKVGWTPRAYFNGLRRLRRSG